MEYRDLSMRLLPCIPLILAAAAVLAQPNPPVLEPYEHPAQDHVYYFVLTDRFEDGNPANNANGGGYDPADPSAYHGGDFAGLRNRLDYLEGLGINAIWLTPIFQNQSVQGGSSAYHGYWITDFLNVDAHLGTNEEFRSLLGAAHDRGMRLFLDIITNHTADVNRYSGTGDDYVAKADAPYRDASGTPFDDRDFAWDGTGEPSFPELDAATSFPLHPTIPNGKEHLRNPDWLNDVRNYHNRGASTFSGENSLYGDFFGLDDLFTEKPEVVQGMIDIYSYWIREYGIDGFRIDTVKHVNREFWHAFGHAMKRAAAEAGTDHFFQFGEVFNFDPAFLSEFSTTLPLDATLDFAMAGEVRAFAYQGVSSANLQYFFSRDDLLTDADSHANARPLFIGNHDIGRAATYARADNPGAPEAELLDRLELAQAILFFCRGQPVLYYGDEQGFAGDGGADVYFREDMMPSQTALYNRIDLVGTDKTTAESNFDRNHPLYQAFSEMAGLYHSHTALRRGAHLTRATGSGSVLAVSRIHRSDLVEYLFVASNRESGRETVTFATSQPGDATFTRIAASAGNAAPGSLAANAFGRVSLSLDGLQWALYRADGPLPGSTASPDIQLTALADGSVQSVQGFSQEGYDFPGRLEVSAATNVNDYAEVTFSYLRSDQPDTWHSLGVDTAPPYRVYFRPPEDIPAGVTYTFAAAVNDARGKTARTLARDIIVTRGAPVTSLIVHYQREDSSCEGWGIVAEGSGLAGGRYGSPSSPQPFIGEDDFGAFAIVPLRDASRPVRFVIQQANGAAAPLSRSWDGFHTIIPQSTSELWIKHGDFRIHPSPGELRGHVDVHYRRTTSAANGWELEIRSATSGTVLQTLHSIETTGRTATYRLDPLALALDWGAEVRLRPVHPVNGYEGASRTLPLRVGGEVWLREDTGRILLSEAASQNVAIIHYRRPAGDYGNTASADFNDFWGLHVWSGAANPTAWSSPLRPVREDAFGLVFEVPLQAGAKSLSYILHRGETKDPGPDQSLPLESAGHEVWQLQAADTDAPYVRTTGLRGIYGGFLAPEEAALRAGLAISPSMNLQLHAPIGRRFRIQESRDLSPGLWTPFGQPFLGTGGQMEFDLPLPDSRDSRPRWYRLLVE